MSEMYVKVKYMPLAWERYDVDVRCPFCFAVTRIPADDAEPVVAGCEHLDRDDCLTPDHDGFSVWFRAGDNDEDEDNDL